MNSAVHKALIQIQFTNSAQILKCSFNVVHDVC